MTGTATRAQARRPGCWPTAEQETLLRAATGEAATAVAAWQAWSSTVDVERLDEGSFRLLPLLYRNIARLGCASPLMPRLKGVHRQSWYKNQLLFRRIADVLGALEAAGVSTLLLKGIPLTVLYYRDEAVRPMADADVLVRPSDVETTRAVLEQYGWHPGRVPLKWPVPYRGSWTFVDHDGRELDLHWHVFPECLYADADDELWAAAQPLCIRGVRTNALCRADQLLHALTHGLHWNPVPSIRWVADALTIIAQRDASMDWERFVTQAETRRFAPVVDVALRYLRDVFDAPVPSTVLERLGARPISIRLRVERWSRTDGSVVAGACRTWFGYLRSLDRTREWPGPVGFVRYLRGFWWVDNPWRLPGVIAGKVTRRSDADIASASR
jgi:hypothetical protein